MTEPKPLHGLAPRSSLRAVCKHEAGHALMFWLFDCHVYGVGVAEYVGIVVAENFKPDTTVSLILLQLMAGMEFGCNREVAYDLETHIDTPEYFHPKSDSYKIPQILNTLHGNPLG